MKASELRSGNWVFFSDYDNPACVDAGDIYDFDHEVGLDVLLPIPLTEEWLLRFGFEHHAGQREYFRHENISLLEFLDQGAEFRIFLDDGTTLCFIKYVHQLQNLYFALTGEELTVKER